MKFDEYYEGQITYLEGDIYQVVNVHSGIDDHGYMRERIDFISLLFI